jgi:RNA polymerase sigma factor for flagellar operon FliA
MEGGVVMASVLRSYDGEREGKLRPIEEYLPFVKRVAQRLARRLPSHIALEDLISAGVVGLLEAMSRYDSSRVTDFEKFAEFRVKGAILDDLRRRDLMARDARLESKNIESAVQELTKELSREPEEEELASRLDLSVPDLRKKLEKLTPVRVVSFTDVYPMNTPTEDDSPFEEYAKKQKLEQLAGAIGKLGERHQQVLQLYYQEDLTLKDIGYVLSVTESRVCQILSEATLRLRAILNPEGAKSDKKKRRARGGYNA